MLCLQSKGGLRTQQGKCKGLQKKMVVLPIISRGKPGCREKGGKKGGRVGGGGESGDVRGRVGSEGSWWEHRVS